MNKPDDIYIDDELFEVIVPDNPDIPCPYVRGPRMTLSPYEVNELIEWLKKYQEYQKEWDKNRVLGNECI